jgi:hypothetical protein
MCWVSTNITMLSQAPESKLLLMTTHIDSLWVWTLTKILIAMLFKEKLRLRLVPNTKVDGLNASRQTQLTLIAQLLKTSITQL